MRLVIAFRQEVIACKLRHVVTDDTSLLTLCVCVCVRMCECVCKVLLVVCRMASRSPSFQEVLKDIYLPFTEPYSLLLERLVLGEEERQLINKQFFEAVISVK